MEYLKKLVEQRKIELRKAESDIANTQKGIKDLELDIANLEAAIHKLSDNYDIVEELEKVVPKKKSKEVKS